MRKWMIQHPDLTGALLAALVAGIVVDVWQVGIMVGAEHGVRAEAARAASEAMGG